MIALSWGELLLAALGVIVGYLWGNRSDSVALDTDSTGAK